MAEISELKTGKALPPKEITDKNGKTYNVVLQVSADRKGVEFVPGGVRPSGAAGAEKPDAGHGQCSATVSSAVVMDDEGRKDRSPSPNGTAFP